MSDDGQSLILSLVTSTKICHSQYQKPQKFNLPDTSQLIIKIFIRLSGADLSSGRWSCTQWCYLWSGIGRFRSDQEHLRSRWRPPVCQQFLKIRKEKRIKIVIVILDGRLELNAGLRCLTIQLRLQALIPIMPWDEMRLRGDFMPMLL